jgi:2-C-methyl-D-erythritol 2,4-cyclodiphosphate synthase
MSLPLRIGHGYDVHAFTDGDGVILGGVAIPYDRGLRAHSDGDVVLHALCDALLGALADGDIGQHFPDTDPAWADADSRALLRAVAARVSAAGYRLANADITVLAEAPKIGPHAAAMRGNIAADLEVSPAQVSVKATTSEGLGHIGRGEGIAVHAVVLLERVP